MSYEKIIDLLIESIKNEYFIYAAAGIISVVTIKSIWEYRLYKKTCIALKQKTKPLGYSINTSVNILALIIITNLGFNGYAAYKNPGITKEIFKKEKREIKENIVEVNKIPIEKKVYTENKNIKLNFKIQKEQKGISEKERAKRKLEKELREAIEAVK